MRVFPCVVLLCCTLPLAAQQAGAGRLKTKVHPGRAGVFVDDKYVGPAANLRLARKYTLPAGEHEVALREPRYQDFTAKVKIEAGKTTTLSQTLQPLPPPQPPFGLLQTVTDDKFAGVFVNGKYMGHAGEFNYCTQGLLLNPGEYAVKIVKPGGGGEYEEKVAIRAQGVTVVQASVKGKAGGC